MNGPKIVAIMVLVAFLATMGWGFVMKWPIDMDVFTADPWLTVMLADLMYGFALISLVIWIVEPVKWKALCWIVPLFIVGNGLSALWLVLNIDKIRTRFST